MTIKDQEKQEFTAKLREILDKDATIYTILRHVSSSGMSRRISLVASVIDPHTGKNEILNLDYWAAKVLDYKIDRDKGGLKVAGAGMDMGYHIVHSLGHALYGNGYTFTHRWL